MLFESHDASDVIIVHGHYNHYVSSVVLVHVHTSLRIVMMRMVIVIGRVVQRRQLRRETIHQMVAVVNEYDNADVMMTMMIMTTTAMMNDDDCDYYYVYDPIQYMI